MVRKSKVNIWGEWLTNGEGWKRLQAFKARKKDNETNTKFVAFVKMLIVSNWFEHNSIIQHSSSHS
jgi:hypothetical protein